MPLETKWSILDQLAGWAILLTGMVCLVAFIISAGRLGIGAYHGHQEVVRAMTWPVIGWGVATAAVSIAWALL